ncbi:hypothetical protein J6590_023886 [Homalodisca vitripennis]|nr:hypothetical protein J6590_023886 [Homalodisca vitripennis]
MVDARHFCGGLVLRPKQSRAFFKFPFWRPVFRSECGGQGGGLFRKEREDVGGFTIESFSERCTSKLQKSCDGLIWCRWWERSVFTPLITQYRSARGVGVSYPSVIDGCHCSQRNRAVTAVSHRFRLQASRFLGGWVWVGEV